jgi:hypothetical protein
MTTQFDLIDAERAAIALNDADRSKLADYLESIMLMGDNETCINSLDAGLDVVLSLNTGTFIAAFARRGEATRYAATLHYACTVVCADNCGEMIHYKPATQTVEGV